MSFPSKTFLSIFPRLSMPDEAQGHGDIFASLYNSGKLDELLAEVSCSQCVLINSGGTG